MPATDMVLLLDFKDGTDPELVSSTQIILLRTKRVAIYSPVEASVTQVETELTAFIAAMSVAMTGGTEEKTKRDEKRVLLETALENLGNDLIANSGGDPLYVTDTTFKLRQGNGSRSREPFEDPLWHYLRRGVLTGTVKGEVQNMPKGARGLLIQWRQVGTTPYIATKPSNGKRILITELPTLTKVEVQVRFFGTHDRLSNWSAPLPVDVV